MSSQHMTARPTTYKGIRMRSRLEALFAQWSDSKKVPWVYEPEAFADHTGQYLPDFRWGAADVGFYFEVKPTSAAGMAAMPAMHRILATHPQARLVAVINEGDHTNLQFVRVAECTPADPCGECDRPSPPKPPYKDDLGLNAGDHVNHRKWGEGVTLSTRVTGAGPEVVIRFESVGEKTLLLQWAPLEKLDRGSR